MFGKDADPQLAKDTHPLEYTKSKHVDNAKQRANAVEGALEHVEVRTELNGRLINNTRYSIKLEGRM